jgi:hypothetical protein
MAKTRRKKKTAKAARKKRPARAKSVRVSKRMTGKPKKGGLRRVAQRKPRKRPKGIVGTVQTVVDAAQEASEMRERMGTRGGLSEG